MTDVTDNDILVMLFCKLEKCFYVQRRYTYNNDVISFLISF